MLTYVGIDVPLCLAKYLFILATQLLPEIALFSWSLTSEMLTLQIQLTVESS